MCRCNVYEQEQELTCSIAQVTNKASPPPQFWRARASLAWQWLQYLRPWLSVVAETGGKVGSGYRG